MTVRILFNDDNDGRVRVEHEVLPDATPAEVDVMRKYLACVTYAHSFLFDADGNVKDEYKRKGDKNDNSKDE